MVAPLKFFVRPLRAIVKTEKWLTWIDMDIDPLNTNIVQV